MLVQLTSSWCAPSPATLEMMMRDGFSCVTENGLMWSLEAANSISDTLAMPDQAPEPRWLRSYQPHLTRELPASMARIIGLGSCGADDGAVGDVARAGARLQAQRAAGREARDAAHGAAVVQAHPQAAAFVGVHRAPVVGKGGE